MKSNRKNKFIVMIIMLLAGISISIKSNAAIQIKSNPGYLIKTGSVAYQLCYDMRNADSTLGTNKLDPHLMNLADWSAANFLSLSSYGENGINREITMNGVQYRTGNSNASGVLCTFYNRSEYTYYTSTVNPYISNSATNSNIYLNKDTKYVQILEDTLSRDNARGLGFFEGNNNTSFSINSLLATAASSFGYNRVGFQNGNEYTYHTFRPAIWNISN